jgi:hypothetical protein
MLSYSTISWPPAWRTHAVKLTRVRTSCLRFAFGATTELAAGRTTSSGKHAGNPIVAGRTDVRQERSSTTSVLQCVEGTIPLYKFLGYRALVLLIS